MDEVIVIASLIAIMYTMNSIYDKDGYAFRESSEYALCIELGGIPTANWSNTLLDDCIMENK